MDYMCTGALEAIKGFWSNSNRITGRWGLPFLILVTQPVCFTRTASTLNYGPSLQVSLCVLEIFHDDELTFRLPLYFSL